MEGFFYIISGTNEEDAVIDRLATRYGWTVPEILDLDAVYLYRMDRKAKEGKNRDDAYQAWLVQLPFMIRKETKYVSFSDYWDRVSGKNLDLRPDAEILAEVAAIREELKGL